jgi:DNA modification methylase
MSVTILVGDVRQRLKELPDESVDCCVTSPPYWGLRDYGVPGQLGLEPTLGEHLAVMVEIFEEVRRVLKPTGNCFINYGDCYATGPNGRSAAATKSNGADDRTFRDKPFSTVGPIYDSESRTPRGEFMGNVLGASGAGERRVDHGGRVIAGGTLKPKDLCMIPNRLAIALQDAGWWVRSEIIWGKTNPMPDSSGSQRPATAHEKIFWLAKSEDGDVWRARDTGQLSFAPDLTERCPLITKPDKNGPRWTRIGTYYDANRVLQGRAGDEDADGFRGGSYVHSEPGPRKARGNRRVKMPDGWDTGGGGHGSHHRNGREKGKRALTPRHEGHINHTGMEDLGRGEGRFLRNYEPAHLPVWEMAIEPFKGAHFATFPTALAKRAILAGCPRGGIVLDPFGGAGTTVLMARALDRRGIMIELNPDYVEIARQRNEAPLLPPVKVVREGSQLSLLDGAGDDGDRREAA